MYTLDTETSNDGRKAWVWSWALCDEQLRTVDGNGLDLIRQLTRLPHGSEVWVHNLDYDGEFLFYALIRDGYRLTYDVYPRDRHHAIFTMLCDLQGIVSMEIWTKGRRIILRDSNRIFRRPLRDLPRLCGFEGDVTKGELNYDTFRAPDHVMTPAERDYQLRDVIVLMRAMQWLRAVCKQGNTIGAIALSEFRATLGNKSPFTPLTLDDRKALRSLYSGGIVYCPPRIVGRRLEVSGNVYDANSMYPTQMMTELPVAVKEWTSGEHRGSGCRAFHVLARGLHLRRDGFPLIITPFTGSARETIDVLDKWIFDGELDAIREEYDVETMEIAETITFDVAAFAAPYTEKWYAIKQLNDERREHAKMLLNNLTGKLAENAIHEQVRREVIDGSGAYENYRYNEIDDTVNKWLFMPATARITSQSRLMLREAAITAGRDKLLYTDTDSIHTTGSLPGRMIDDARLGAWKCENRFDAAMYVKPKSYYEELCGEVQKCKHAGLNNDATLGVYDGDDLIDTGEVIGPANMRPGAIYFTRQSRACDGGVIIERRPKRM